MAVFALSASYVTGVSAQSSLPTAPAVATTPSPSSGSPSPLIAVDTSKFSESQLAGVRLLEMPPPELVVAGKLKQFGFAASYRFTEKQKQLVPMSAAKDLPGIVKLFTGKEYAKPGDVEDAARAAGNYDQQFTVAIQSTNIATQGREFRVVSDTSPNKYFISVLLLPKDVEHLFNRSADGRLTTKAHLDSGMDRGFEEHPLKNGYLYHVARGDFVVLCFLDWMAHRENERGKFDMHGPGHQISDALGAFQRKLDGLNRQRELGELSSEQLLTQARAEYKAFAEAIRPYMQ